MFRRSAICLFALLSACESLAVPPPAGQSDTRWLGIPYATAARWELPEPNADWAAAAPFDAFGPACPQRGQTVMTEDCLFLNVFTPQNAEGAPVLVWFHGGGFMMGEGGDGLASFTEDGFVVVTFNYRLGKLGFHDWPGWDEGDPRNFGQADMVAALQWVQANIARFGGDPDEVTLFGHSAGGMGVQLMLVDERADGLFHKAIAHSGYAAWPFPKAANPTPDMRARMRIRALALDTPPAALVADVTHFHLPYVGGSDLGVQPLDLFRDGQSGSEPYLSGANSHDGGGTLQGAGFSPLGFLDIYEGKSSLTSAYAEFVDPGIRAEKIFGDMRYAYSSRETARAHGGPSALFYLDGPEPGLGHGEHYPSLYGQRDDEYRRLLVDFMRNGVSGETSEPGWTVLGSVDAECTREALDGRLDSLGGLTWPQP